MRLGILVTLALSGGLALACTGAHTSPNDKVQFPARIGGEGDAAPLTKVGTMVSGDGQRLTFDLEHDPSAAAVQLWACWELPAPTTPLGRAVCTTDDSKSFEVTASYVDFVCRSNPEFGVVRAVKDADAGCPSYDVFTYSFEPNAGLQVVGSK